ncbi:Conserved hypothetical protein [Ehrlichia ruminantium str. Gardel]|uniref:ankyrin repeat domain-containing protein n=1 Tax=Ehrlichia ruminantium TaxID=779 RepID=UPI00004C7738|nr:ankyrin repeat domain-containing protein [Ehrlichia ruminantium]CAI27668.1 Conserved hypothetical protein [Ehrlichia ruminantium str. Gardel]
MLGNDTKLTQRGGNLLSRNLNLLNNECVQNIVLSEKDIEELRSVRTHGISSKNFKILNVLLANSSKSGDFSVFFEELLSRLGRGKSKRIRRESSFLILQDAVGKYSIERSINAICERYNGQGLLYICDIGTLPLVFSHESSERAAFISSIANSNFEIQESKISKISIICANGKLKYKPVFFNVTPLQYAVENDDIQTVGMLCNVLMKYEDGKQIVKEVTRYVLSKINRKQDDVTDKVLECIDCLLELQDEFNLNYVLDLLLVKQLKSFTHIVCTNKELLKKVCKTPYENIVKMMCLLELNEVEQREPIKSIKECTRNNSQVISDDDVLDQNMVYKVYGPDQDNIIFLMMQSDNIGIVEQLFVNYNIDVNTQNMYGYTALHFAAMYNAKRCAEFLLKCNSGKSVVLRKHVKSSITPFHLAAASGSIDVLKLLVKYNPDDIEKRDAMGRSIVHHAAMSNDSSTLSFCIDLGLNVNDQVMLHVDNDLDEGINDSEGCTALHFAVEAGNLPIVAYLLSCKNIDLSIKNAEGDTPINSTMRTMNSKGNTLLHQCVVCDDAKLLQKAINVGWKSSILVCNAVGKTALDIAIERHRVECAEILLKYYYNEKYQDASGNTVFTMSDCEGNTLIHQAAAFGNSSIVKSLLLYDAISLARVNCHNETPLDIAIKNNNRSVISCLLADKRQKLFDVYGSSYVMKLISKGLMTEEMCRIINNRYFNIQKRQYVRSFMLSTLIFLLLVGIIVYVFVIFNDKISLVLDTFNANLLVVKMFLCGLLIFLTAVTCTVCCLLCQLNHDLVKYKKLLPMNTSNMHLSAANIPTETSSSISSDYIRMYNKKEPTSEGSSLEDEETIGLDEHRTVENTNNTIITQLSIEDYRTLQLT